MKNIFRINFFPKKYIVISTNIEQRKVMFSLLFFDVCFTIMFSLIKRVKLLVLSCKMNFENSLKSFIKLPEIYLTNETKSNKKFPFSYPDW